MDSVDKAIWVLPFLALLDVVSTFYAAGQDYPLLSYDQRIFANFFVAVDLIYVYIFAAPYLLIMLGAAYGLWFMKNRKLNSSRSFDKAIFITIVGMTYYIYARLTSAFLVNFLFRSIHDRGISLFWITAIVYISTLFSLGYYLWHDVLYWVISSNGHEKARQ